MQTPEEREAEKEQRRTAVRAMNQAIRERARDVGTAARGGDRPLDPVFHSNVEGQPNKRLAHEGRWRQHCPICTPPKDEDAFLASKQHYGVRD